MVQTRHFSPLRHNTPTTAALGAPNDVLSCAESSVANLPARSSTPPLHLVTSIDRRARVLLACLADYTLTAESPASPGDRSDPASAHARETQRLVALLTTHLSAPLGPYQASPPPAALTRREIEVLDAVADGLSTIEIADVLHISVNTARNHVQRIIEKLGVHSRLQAVNEGVRHGLLHRQAG